MYIHIHTYTYIYMNRVNPLRSRSSYVCKTINASPVSLCCPGWLNLTAIQILFYVYMGLVEDYL